MRLHLFLLGVRMENWQKRQEMLVGAEGIQTLKNARVAVVGLGGVGSAAVEALVRAGVGNLLLVDNDVLSITNLNRQLIATLSTVGEKKTAACEKRARSINPEINVQCADAFVLPGQDAGIFAFAPHYIIDAVDTMAAKLFLIQCAGEVGIPLISCMGTGNRTSASGFKIGDIADTAGSGCPVARTLRRELKKRGVERAEVLFNETPPQSRATESDGARHAPGSISYVPPVAGFLAAGHVIEKLLQSGA